MYMIAMQAAVKEKNDSCILVVGTTGTGKTSTVRWFPRKHSKLPTSFFSPKKITWQLRLFGKKITADSSGCLGKRSLDSSGCLTKKIMWQLNLLGKKDHLTAQVNIYTGNELTVGHSAHAETGATVTVEDKNHPGAPAWIDNPGALRTSSLR